MGSTTGWAHLDNSSNKVFSGATNDISWKRTACGIPETVTGLSSSGTNLFRNDGYFLFNRAGMFAISTGDLVLGNIFSVLLSLFK